MTDDTGTNDHDETAEEQIANDSKDTLAVEVALSGETLRQYEYVKENAVGGDAAPPDSLLCQQLLKNQILNLYTQAVRSE